MCTTIATIGCVVQHSSIAGDSSMNIVIITLKSLRQQLANWLGGGSLCDTQAIKVSTHTHTHTLLCVLISVSWYNVPNEVIETGWRQLTVCPKTPKFSVFARQDRKYIPQVF